jgi:hypothetical protein
MMMEGALIFRFEACATHIAQLRRGKLFVEPVNAS